MQLTLKHCKYYQIPLLTIKDYIDEYKKRFAVLLNDKQVRRMIKQGRINYVKHDRRIYVVIESQSMENLRLPKSAKILVKENRNQYAKWHKIR